MYYWKSIGNSLKLTFLEQHKIKKTFTSITKLKIIQLTDDNNNYNASGGKF